MPIDTQVLSSGSVPQLFQTEEAKYDQWSTWKTALLAATVFMKIFVNNVIVSRLTELAAFVESTAPGYAPVQVTTLNGPAIDVNGNVYMTTQQVFFTCSGGGSDTGYGAYLVEVTGAAATVTFTEAGGLYTAPVITSGGSGYEVAPKVTVTGATGSGAVLTAQITGGVVTGITIVNPGSGYTTATAVIEPPTKLVASGNFQTPLPLAAPTDAIPVVMELDNLAD